MCDNKTIVFDFDGTIADTLDTVIDVYNTIAPRVNCKQIKYKDKETLRNKDIWKLLKSYNVSLIKLPFIILQIRSELNKQISQIKPQMNICGVLRKLKNQGYDLGILTTNSKENIDSFLLKNNLAKIFNFVYTGKSIFGKHKVINRLLRAKQISKNDIIYVGDEVRDIEATKKVNIPIIAVTWGFNKKDILRKQNPEYIIDKPEELFNCLKLL